MTLDEMKEKIAEAFSSTFSVPKTSALSCLPDSLTAGKAYEAYVLSVVCENLVRKEGCSLVLRKGSKLVLKGAPGPINRNYPWIEVVKSGVVVGEIFTDVEFLTLSFGRQRRKNPGPGDYHELDIVMTHPGVIDRPWYYELLLGVECKNTSYKKSLLKEILGVRREMSLLSSCKKTGFASWPRSRVSADPPSCLLVYSTNRNVAHYSAPGLTFGIDFYHRSI